MTRRSPRNTTEFNDRTMSIETICTECGTLLSVADEHAGCRARCPQCRAEYEVPSESDLSALDAHCHFCGTALDDSSDAGKQPSADVPYRICRECQSSIDENQEELEQEARRVDGARNGVIVAGVVVGGMLLAIFLAKLFFATH